MSDRLLKESDVIEVVTQYISCDYPTEEMAREDAEILIGRTPSADTDLSEYSDKLWKNAYERGKADRPQGEWIYKDDDVFAGEYTCSNCNKKAEVDLYGQWILSNYCPHCGARMKGADDETHY